MKKTLILLLFLSLGTLSSYAQAITANEAMFIRYLRQQTSENNPVISDSDYQLYCTNFHREEYFKTEKNEFARAEFKSKIQTRLKRYMKIPSFELLFFYPSIATLGEYNFSYNSFPTNGSAGLPKFKYTYWGGGGVQLIVSADIINGQTFFKFPLPMTPDVARTFLTVHPNRTVYTVAIFSFLDDQSGVENTFNVHVKRLEVYSDKGLTNKIKTIVE